MWFNNSRDKEVKRDQIEVFKILNGYENIDRNMFFFSLQYIACTLRDLLGSRPQ